MSTQINYSGYRLDVKVDQGSTAFSNTVTIFVGGLPATPTDARITFRNGSLAEPGTIVDNVTGFANITDNTVSFGIGTADETRAFDPDEDYCWALEVDLPSGLTQRLFYGTFTATPEI